MCDDDDDSDGDGDVGGRASSFSCSRRSSRAAWATDFSQLLRKILSRWSREMKALKIDSRNVILTQGREIKVVASKRMNQGICKALQGTMAEGEG